LSLGIGCTVLLKLIGLIVACVIFILVGAQIGWLPSANVEKFFAIVEFGETFSYQSRVLIWNQTLQLLSGHLLFGYGAGASEDILGFSPHNLLFEIWVECGLVGVFLFLVGFSFIFIEEELRRRIEKRGTEDVEVVNKRLERAKKEIAYASNYDYIIVNDNLKDAVEGLRSIIKAEKLKLKRNRDVLCQFEHN